MSNLIHSSSREPIRERSRVTLHFALLLENGEVIDTTRDGDPATFTMGDGKLLPGFEDALAGLRAGDDEQIRVPAERAFGPRRAENVRALPRESFANVCCEPGSIVSFASPSGELPGVVQEISDATVTVDFNHPLAGRDIVFDVTVIRVTQAE